MNENKLIDKIENIIKPAAEDLGYELYHIEFVTEDGEKYLRIFIDNDKGISLSDCEKVSRKVSALLDEYDPIEEHYILEVSSPGIERILFTDKHLNKYLNSQVTVSLNNEKDKIEGNLAFFDEENINLSNGGEIIKIKRDNISQINLKGDF